MFKVMILAKRRAGMAASTFAETFESLHVPEVNKMVAAGIASPMLSYHRNYIQHGHELGTVQLGDLDFDVIIECTFLNRAAFDFTRSVGERHPSIPKAIQADLERYVDLSTMRYLIVETCSGGAGAPPL